MTAPGWYARGPQGSSIHAGSDVPASGIGNDGDLYLRTSNGDLYTKTAGAWTITGNLQGPTGPGGGTTIVDNGDGTIAITSTSSGGDISGGTP